MLSLLPFIILARQANECIMPVPRPGADWVKRHEAMNSVASTGGIELAFIGDSITHAFGGAPFTGLGFENRGKDTWDLFYGDRKAINLGISGDRTQHVLWRLENGNMNGIKPKVAIVMIGTNNAGANSTAQISEGIQAVCLKVRQKSPRTKILLLAVFPRGNSNSRERARLAEVNTNLSLWAPKNKIEFLDIGNTFLDAKGEIPNEVMPDKLHPMAYGYRLWAMAMEQRLSQMLRTKPKSVANPMNSAVVPVTQQRDSYNWMERHNAVLSAKSTSKHDLVFIGDSILHFWGGSPKAHIERGRDSWNQHFAQWNPLNMAFGWDRTENVLWRMEQGELDSVNPRGVVICIGTNNLQFNTAVQTAEGVATVVSLVRAKAPKAKILLLGLLPRGYQSNDPLRLSGQEVNKLLVKVGKQRNVMYKDISSAFVSPDGTISRDTMADYLHPTEKGYQLFAQAIHTELAKMMP